MQDFFTVHNLGRGFERPESGIAHPGNGAPFGIYASADGWISIVMCPWSKIVQGLGDPALEAYNNPQILFDQRDQIYEVLQQYFHQKTTAEWLDILLALDIWCAPALELKDVANDPQVRHLEAFTEIDHPKAGRVRVTNIPFRMSGTPGSIRRPAPLVGQHGRVILRELGYNENRITELESRGLLTVEEIPTQ